MTAQGPELRRESTELTRNGPTGHTWPCPGFYRGNWDIRGERWVPAGGWSCTCAMSTEPLDPARLAAIRERVEAWAPPRSQDAYAIEADRRLLLAEVDRLAEALTAERARVQRVEAWANRPGRSGQPRDGVLRALAGDTEGES